MDEEADPPWDHECSDGVALPQTYYLQQGRVLLKTGDYQAIMLLRAECHTADASLTVKSTMPIKKFNTVISIIKY